MELAFSKKTTEGLQFGGAWAVMYFFDDMDMPVTEELATHAEVVEYGLDGAEVGRSYVQFDKE